MPDTSAVFSPSLIGNFVFDDELLFAQDPSQVTVDGYLIAMDVLVSRMLHEVQEVHTPQELETIENINFYPVYNLADHTVKIDGTYWFMKNGKEKHGSFVLPISKEEAADLIQALDAYCIKQDSKDCLAILNAFRAEDGLPPVDTHAAITAVAEKVRKDLQQEYGEDLAGCCIEASDLLVERLSSELNIDANAVEGWCQYDDEMYGSDRPWGEHTWVELPAFGLYVDVTADQFNYGMSRENEFLPVLVQKGLPHGMRYDEPSWAEYGVEEEEVQEKEMPKEDFPAEQREDGPTITRSPGIAVGLGYIVGGGYEGYTKALDDAVIKEAELLREHYGADVTIRFNSDCLSGGAWLMDAVEHPLSANGSIGLGAELINSKLLSMSLDQKLDLPHHEFQALRRDPDILQFTTAIDLEKTHHTVPADSKHILQNSEYRIFTSLNEAAAYLFSHVVGLREEYQRKEPLGSKIQTASVKADQKAPVKNVPHISDRDSRT